MDSVGDVLSEDFKITIYAKDVNYYLCFAQGKLVGKVSITIWFLKNLSINKIAFVKKMIKLNKIWLQKSK